VSDTTISRSIIQISHQLAHGRAGCCGVSLARTNRWLDDQGRATPEGRALVEALVGQRETRTIYRFLA
jgi:hypothetical protein